MVVLYPLAINDFAACRSSFEKPLRLQEDDLLQAALLRHEKLTHALQQVRTTDGEWSLVVTVTKPFKRMVRSPTKHVTGWWFGT